MPQKLLEAIAVSDMEVAGVTSLGKSLSKNTRKREGKRKMAAAAEASAAKQARVAALHGVLIGVWCAYKKRLK